MSLSTLLQLAIHPPTRSPARPPRTHPPHPPTLPCHHRRRRVPEQVLADRGETGSKFGRATFSVLLLQDLAVVVLLMLIPLLAPSPDGVARELGGAGVCDEMCCG